VRSPEHPEYESERSSSRLPPAANRQPDTRYLKPLLEDDVRSPDAPAHAGGQVAREDDAQTLVLQIRLDHVRSAAKLP
jgi:hypothetical protein